jgi:hypothetical protein
LMCSSDDAGGSLLLSNVDDEGGRGGGSIWPCFEADSSVSCCVGVSASLGNSCEDMAPFDKREQ